MNMIQRTFVADRVIGKVRAQYVEAQESGDASKIEAARDLKKQIDHALMILWSVMDYNSVEFAAYDRRAGRFHEPPGATDQALLRCPERNAVAMPSRFESKGYCPHCGSLATIKQNGRLYVHWAGKP
jgi:hypothetical protein